MSGILQEVTKPAPIGTWDVSLSFLSIGGSKDEETKPEPIDRRFD